MTKAQQRLFQVNKAYDAAHLSTYNEFNKAYIAKAREMGLRLPTSLKEHMAMPVAFHMAMKEASAACVGGLMLAQEARRASTRETGRRR